MKILVVDPPSGWKYGFPKEVPLEESPCEEWFLANGYPKELINQGMLKYLRFWYKEVEDTQD